MPTTRTTTKPKPTTGTVKPAPPAVPPEVAVLYRAKAGRIDIVQVPPLLVLAIDGTGVPPNQAFSDGIGALYAVAFTAKFALRARGIATPKMLPIGSQWDILGQRSEWPWTLLVPQLPPMDAKALRAAIKACKAKQPTNAALDRVQVRTVREGRCAQTLHLGSYESVPQTAEALLAALPALGLRPAGRYQEIYLNDPSRVAVDKLKTLCRIPVAKA